MKTKKKILPVLAGSILLTLALGACGSTGTSSGSNPQGGGNSSVADSIEQKINVTADKKQMIVGETLQLKADVEGVSWSTRDDECITVSATGLVTAIKAGTAKVTAKKDGYTNGSITLTIEKAPEKEADYILRLEDAEHYDPDDFWGMDLSQWGYGIMGPGDSPIENNNGATDDSTSLGYLQQGCKETLKFTSDKAVKVEIGVTMAYNAVVQLEGVIKVTFNGKEISMAGRETVAPEDESNYYEFHAISFGEVDLIAGTNVLEIEMLGQAPNMDNVVIYTKEKLTLATIPAPKKETIVVEAAEVEIEVEQTSQIKTATEGVTYTSLKPEIATVSETGLITGVKAGKATIEVTKEGMKKATVTVTVKNKAVAGEIILEAENGELGGSATVENNNEAASGGAHVGYLAAETSLTLKYTASSAGTYAATMAVASNNVKDWSTYPNVVAEEMDLAPVMTFTVNDAAVSLEGKVIPGGAWGTWVIVDLGDIDLIAGENVFKFDFLAQGPNIDYLKLVSKNAGGAESLPAEDANTLTCEFEDAVLNRTEGSNETNCLVIESSETSTASGQKSVGYVTAGSSIDVKFNASAAGEIGLGFIGASTSADWSGGWSNIKMLDLDLTTCMAVKVNGAALDLTNKVLPGCEGMNYQNWQPVNLGKISVLKGENSISFEFTAQGPNLDCVKLYGSDAVKLSK